VKLEVRRKKPEVKTEARSRKPEAGSLERKPEARVHFWLLASNF
jgi:hypothetical protein